MNCIYSSSVTMIIARLAIRWTVVVPVLAVVVLAATWGSKPATAVLAFVGVLLASSVLAAVHHAEVVAHRVGEPFGVLILAVAVTVGVLGSFALLVLALVAVVGPAKVEAPAIEGAIKAMAHHCLLSGSRSPCSCCSLNLSLPSGMHAAIGCRRA
jgi:Ca2+/H+ antiporter